MTAVLEPSRLPDLQVFVEHARLRLGKCARLGLDQCGGLLLPLRIVTSMGLGFPP